VAFGWRWSPGGRCVVSLMTSGFITRRCAGMARQGLADQLRAQLECFWPSATKVFTEIDCPTALAFLDLERYPRPADARGLGEQHLAAFLPRQGYSGERKPRELLDRLRGAALGRAGELEIQAHRQIVLGLVAALKPLREQITQLRAEIRVNPPGGARASGRSDGPIAVHR